MCIRRHAHPDVASGRLPPIRRLPHGQGQRRRDRGDRIERLGAVRNENRRTHHLNRLLPRGRADYCLARGCAATRPRQPSMRNWPREFAEPSTQNSISRTRAIRQREPDRAELRALPGIGGGSQSAARDQQPGGCRRATKRPHRHRHPGSQIPAQCTA